MMRCGEACAILLLTFQLLMLKSNDETTRILQDVPVGQTQFFLFFSSRLARHPSSFTPEFVSTVD